MSRMSLLTWLRVARQTPLAGLRNAMINAKPISWLQLPLRRLPGHGRLSTQTGGPACSTCSRCDVRDLGSLRRQLLFAASTIAASTGTCMLAFPTTMVTPAPHSTKAPCPWGSQLLERAALVPCPARSKTCPS